MEDFEYSVEICDRDWECFFAECEECNLLPPSLAGVDDSGMSDMDDAGSILAKRAQRVDPAACFSVTERPIDGPPDYEGSPVKHYLTKHGAGGLENVLSGSEEDLHLQSVNLFFEGLKGLAEDKRPSEPGKSREEEEEEEEGRRGGDGHRASGNTLPTNIPKLNCLSAKGETAVGNETVEPEGTMRHTNTVRKDLHEIKIPNEPAPAEPETPTSEKTKVSITGSTNGTTQQKQQDSEVETFTGKGGIEMSGTDSTRSPDVKWKENRSASQAWSPASIKKRRRKKRRLGEGGQISAKQSDTDEERYSSPGSLCLAEDAASFYPNEPQTNVAESTQRTTAGSDETTDNGSVTAPRQSDYNNIRATSSRVNGGTHLEERDCSSVSVPGKSNETRESQRKDVEGASLHQVNQPEPNGKCHSAEVKSVCPAHTPALGSIQNDRRSAAKSAVAAEAGNSGEDERTPRQTEAEPQKQLEIHCHNTDQDGALLKKTCSPLSAVAPHLPHAEPQQLTSVNSSLNDRRCEASLQKETACSLKSEKTEVKLPDSQVKVELTKSNHEDLLTSTSDVTHLSSACSLDSITSLSNATDLSASFSSSLSEGKSILDQEEGDQQCDLLCGAEETTASQPKKGKNSVFAISSFWSEMEKLTINDILGLRMMSRASPPGCLPPLQETEEAEMLDGTNEDISSNPGYVESNSPDLSSLKSITWESEPVLLSHVTEAPPAFIPAGPQQGLRKISKNVSMHNLCALEPQTFDGVAEEVKCFKKSVSNQDEGVMASPPSLTGSYSFSLTDIFQYFFSGKQSLPNPLPPENPVYTSGDSVPESYDHFFSEFDTESFFYPLRTTEDKEVPIFSCTRSTSRNLQFPEAYEYFFKSSSSSDDSSDEEEDDGRPVRVVTRFSRKASSSQLSTDVYEDFFTDQEDFFWKTTFSFRNVNFPASTVQTQRSNSAHLVPLRTSRTSYPRALHHLNVLGNQEVMFPDPLLGRLEERISRQLVQRPFTYEDLQTVVSNPRLDAPFLPLKQSDMCMVCIAFASWVLKTANPQVGDAWKAVLLANISALSAIGYLRKYVRVEAATSETKPPES